MSARDYQTLYRRPPFPPTPMPYRVHTCGRVVNAPRHATMGTYNEDCMLTVFVAGTGYYRRGGKVQRIVPGMVGVVLPGADVGVLLSDEKDPYEHLFCRFAGEVGLAAAARILHAREGENFCASPLCLNVAQALMRMVGPGAGHIPENGLFADRMRPCDGMLAETLAILDCPDSSGTGLTVAGIDGFVAEHLMERIDLRVMAEHFGVTKEYLCRRVKVLMGRSPLDLWREAKMVWARTLLRNAGLGVAETARRVGFDDPYYFSRVFKQCMGKTPSHYLQRSADPGAAGEEDSADSWTV